MSVYLVIGVIAGAGLAIVWRGYVLSIVWAWFMVGPFGLPALTIAQAIGLALVSAALMHRYTPPSTDKAHQFGALADMVFQPLLVLGIAWIVRGFL